MIGRENELGLLRNRLAEALDGKGFAVLLSGEASIGKTRLLNEFLIHAESQKIKVISGAAASDSAHPFLVFSKALEGELASPLFVGQKHITFSKIFTVDSSGLLIAEASPETEGLDTDIFAGMLSAVQDFVRDSFDRDSLDGTGQQTAGLGRLEYGDMTILQRRLVRVKRNGRRRHSRLENQPDLDSHIGSWSDCCIYSISGLHFKRRG